MFCSKSAYSSQCFFFLLHVFIHRSPNKSQQILRAEQSQPVYKAVMATHKWMILNICKTLTAVMSLLCARATKVMHMFSISTEKCQIQFQICAVNCCAMWFLSPHICSRMLVRDSFGFFLSFFPSSHLLNVIFIVIMSDWYICVVVKIAQECFKFVLTAQSWLQ